uniref:Contactin-associated protein-like 4 n=1 Tax=Fundulus heteroclitus TaxID=8078 RepID=A0A3Q2Q7C3_FUNHE
LILLFYPFCLCTLCLSKAFHIHLTYSENGCNLWLFVPFACIGAGGWSPLLSDKYQWLEVDLQRRTQITAVATQGRYGSSDWLTSYLLMFSDTGHNWRQHRQEDSLGVSYVTTHILSSSSIIMDMDEFLFLNSSEVAGFDGRSSLVFRLSARTSWTARDSISLKFKTLKNSGTLLHAKGQRDHSLNLALEKGKLLLYHQQDVSSGSGGKLLVSLGSLLDDQHWHHIKLERLSTHLNLTVDKNLRQVHLPAELSHWHIYMLSVGAVHSHGLQTPILHNRNFHGCLENLLYNDLNLIKLAKQNSPQVTAGNMTFSCSEPVFVAVTFTDSRSFLQLPVPTSRLSGAVSVTLQFRTWNKAGLLLTFGLRQQEGSVFLYLSDARLRLQISKTGNTLLELSTGSGLNDGQWHSVELIAEENHLSITVDRDEGATAHTSCPAHRGGWDCRNPFQVFQGCMRLLKLDGQPVDLIKVQERRLGNYSALQIDMCGIIDRCSPSHCEHGGGCTQSWSTFHCNCSNTGYRGATCHSSKYEQSCEIYKHKGDTSGPFHIDVDGSGPIKPQLVYCNMTEDQTWIVMQHDNTELTTVQVSPDSNQHFANFRYPSEETQLSAIIGQSEHCEQELSFHCKRSRLFNTLDGAPLSWWVGGPASGHIQNHWGGASPGSRQCACGLQDNCLDSSFSCNCDADYDLWTDDSGLLTHKETLPVRSLVLGDIHRPGSEAAYRVGPLRCYGDKNFWNAAFFDKETSYLHFPTFNGELNADISFLFRTTSSSGLFLENLGIKDFIRIELSSSTEVVFSFDVGNGPLEVKVKTALPLNDNRWHRVQAERNVKEASLRVDDFPATVRAAPSDGFIHLQLNSQLFIGGTASRQKGFLGCIRSLQLNGVTLDLEERARITPGVRPGCPGHCSSYAALCQNQGRCVERANGFSCDCSQSAHAGAFCHKEVSGSFKSTTSITYIVKEPYEPSRNSGSLHSSIYSDITLRGEDISLSFRTSQSPALLLYVSSFYREYLILLINKHDELEVRYKLHSSRDVEVLSSRVMNLADGRLHTVTIRRQADMVSVQVNTHKHTHLPIYLTKSEGLDPDLARLASTGFTGCLSGVRFDSICPLKAALLHPDSRVTVTSPLVPSSCASSSQADSYAAETTHSLSGNRSMLTSKTLSSASHHWVSSVIAVVIFIIVSAAAIMARFICIRKETYRNQEVKAAQPEDSREFPLSSQTRSLSVHSENQKEFFI